MRCGILLRLIVIDVFIINKQHQGKGPQVWAAKNNGPTQKQRTRAVSIWLANQTLQITHHFVTFNPGMISVLL